MWTRDFHARSKTFTGRRTFQIYPTLLRCCQTYKAKTLLDYGAGKGEQFADNLDLDIKRIGKLNSLKEGLGVDEIVGYDPGVPQFAVFPEGRVFDGVYLVDVLEYIPVPDYPWVLRRMANAARHFLIMNFNCCPGKKLWGGGTVPLAFRPREWYFEQLLPHLPGRLDVFLRCQLERNVAWQLWRRAPGEQEATYLNDSQWWPEGV